MRAKGAASTYDLLRAVVLGGISGVAGTGLGGALAAFWREPRPRPFAAMVGFSAGMMLAVTVLDLLPEAVSAHLLFGAAGTLAGLLSMAAADSATARCPRHRGRAGIVVGAGIAAHNFAEGLAVGSGYTARAALGVRIAVLIGLHDVPEGLAMATIIRLEGAPRYLALASAVVAGLPMAGGALAGAVAGAMSTAGLALSLGAAAGAMLYITIRLFPEGAGLSESRALFAGTFLGLASGSFLVAVM